MVVYRGEKKWDFGRVGVDGGKGEKMKWGRKKLFPVKSRLDAATCLRMRRSKKKADIRYGADGGIGRADAKQSLFVCYKNNHPNADSNACYLFVKLNIVLLQ